MTSASVALSPDAEALDRKAPVCANPIRFIKPTLPELSSVLNLYQEAYNDGTITNANVVRRFEQRVEEMLQVRHCVAVSSCTSGLALVLRSFKLEKPEVIVPSFTFFATGHAVVWNGLTPVFADCDPLTWTIDPESVEERITERTGAIIGVHLYGNPCDVVALERLASKYGLKLIFDSAHGFGSSYRGRPVGQFGDAEVFSLSPTKLLVAGEGGLVTTSDPALAHSIRAARNYGDLGAYDPEVLGLNARMTEFNAALGLAGLDLVQRKLDRHNEIARLYDALLADLPGLSFQHVDSRDISTFKDYSVSVDAEAFGMSRDELAEALASRNVTTKKYFSPPLHRQALYAAYYEARPCDLRHTNHIADTVLSLPIYESLPDDTVRAVAGALRDYARS
jgi:dTDP-4-amino-4,6-dideoxygalactose transaminase